MSFRSRHDYFNLTTVSHRYLLSSQHASQPNQMVAQPPQLRDNGPSRQLRHILTLPVPAHQTCAWRGRHTAQNLCVLHSGYKVLWLRRQRAARPAHTTGRHSVQLQTQMHRLRKPQSYRRKNTLRLRSGPLHETLQTNRNITSHAARTSLFPNREAT